MPATERDAVLATQAAQAEAAYRTDPDLCGFDAFGEDDLNGDDPAAQHDQRVGDLRNHRRGRRGMG